MHQKVVVSNGSSHFILQNSSETQKAYCGWFWLGKGIKLSIGVIQGSNQIYTTDLSIMRSQLALLVIFLLSQMCFHRQKLEFAFGIEKKFRSRHSLPNFAIKALLKFLILLIPRPPLPLGLHMSPNFSLEVSAHLIYHPKRTF